MHPNPNKAHTDSEDHTSIGDAIPSLYPDGMVDTCYYDGTCGLCQRSRGILETLDWFGALRFVDQSAVAPDRLPVESAIADAGMPMTTGDGRVYVGFPAVRRAMMRTPLGMLFAWPLYLPGIDYAGKRVYAVIAANRHSVCSLR